MKNYLLAIQNQDIYGNSKKIFRFKKEKDRDKFAKTLKHTSWQKGEEKKC